MSEDRAIVGTSNGDGGHVYHACRHDGPSQRSGREQSVGRRGAAPLRRCRSELDRLGWVLEPADEPRPTP